MKRSKKKDTAFPGNMKGYLSIKFDDKTKEIIKTCVNNGIFYGIFRVSKDGMTCNDQRSIPKGSGIFVYDLEIDLRLSLIDNIFEIPMCKPLGLVVTNSKKKTKLLITTITFVDAVNNFVKLTSYNPAPKYNGWIPIIRIQKIFMVLQVISKEDLISKEREMLHKKPQRNI